MCRQKFTSHLLVFALAGVAALAGCTSQQQVRTSDARKPAPTTREAPKRTAGWPTVQSSDTMAAHAVADPTGDPKTSVVGLEKVVPREVRMGQEFEYMLIATNFTNHTLVDVSVIDEHEGGLRVVSSNPRGQTMTGGEHVWDLGKLAAKETKTIRVRAQATAEGAIGNCATVTYNATVCATIPVVAPKLRLTKTGPAEVLACDDIVYSFEVSNPGTGHMRSVKITDQLPAGLTAPGGGRTLTFDAGSLAAGASKKFSANVKAERSGRYENRATATGEGGVTAESGTVATVVRKPVLRISKTCPTRQFVGRPTNYEITVTNSGDGIAKNVVIEDQIPNGASFVSASDGGTNAGNRVTWQVASLAPNASKKVRLTVNPSAPGRYRNVATARAHCADPVSDDCTTEVTGIPAILLEVIDIEDPDQIGTDEIYVITVTNQGSAPATGIRIVCTLEPNQTFASSTGATRATARGATVTMEPLATLAPKAKATWRVVVDNVRAGDVRFKVTMNSDQLTRPVEETEATNVYE